jgi:hypothetical protein
LQFLTMSGSANTLIAQALLAFSFVRTPFMVVANYSLGHKLKRRPPEDRQRFLGNVKILLPDGPEENDWLEVLDEYEHAVPGVFAFKFRDEAKPLWSLSAGVNRELVSLLVLAYCQARARGATTVSWEDVDRAYVQADFSDSRADIEALIMQGIGSQDLKESLRCPFPIPLSTSQEYDIHLKAVRAAKVANAALEASMSQSERGAKEFVEKLLNSGQPVKGNNGCDASKVKRTPRTVASMREAGEQFRARMKKGS